MNNLKYLVLTGALVLCANVAKANTASDDVARYFNNNGTGGGAEVATIVGANVAPGDLNTMEGLVQQIAGSSCTRASGCYVILDASVDPNATPTLPSSTVTADMRQAAQAIALQHRISPDAPIFFVDLSAKDATTFTGAVTKLDNVSTRAFLPLFSVALSSQTSINAYLDQHNEILPIAPAGFLARGVPVGGTEIVSGTDTLWTGHDSNSILGHAKNVTKPWGAEDDLGWAAAEIAAALNTPSGMQTPAAFSGVFQSVSGSSSVGVFKSQP